MLYYIVTRCVALQSSVNCIRVNWVSNLPFCTLWAIGGTETEEVPHVVADSVFLIALDSVLGGGATCRSIWQWQCYFTHSSTDWHDVNHPNWKGGGGGGGVSEGSSTARLLHGLGSSTARLPSTLIFSSPTGLGIASYPGSRPELPSWVQG